MLYLYLGILWVGFCVLLYFRTRPDLKPAAFAAAALLCPIFGFLAGKIAYDALLFNQVVSRFGTDGLFRLDPSLFSLIACFGGITLGLAAAARVGKLPARKVLDASAIGIALLWCGMKTAEGAFPQEMQTLGLGHWMKDERLCFFPFAVRDSWGGSLFAVFFFSALSGLVTAVVAFARRKTGEPHFRRTVYYLALSQILWENMRSMSMRWGFVRIEQVLCAVILLAVLTVSLIHQKAEGKEYALILGSALLGLCAIIALEFIMDKTDWSILLGYGMFLWVLMAMALPEMRCVRRETERTGR